MGIAAGGSKNGHKASINVTPLVDVVLVLLIIFMVTVPLKMEYVTVDIPPEADEDQDVSLANKQIQLLVHPDGTVLIKEGIEEVEVNQIDLIPTLETKLAKRRDKSVFVDCDDATSWREAVVVIDSVTGIGDDVQIAVKLREQDKPDPAAPTLQTP